MGDPSPSRPHPAVRALLAVLVAAFSVLFVAPTAIAVLFVVGFGVVATAAHVLSRAGGLALDTFEQAHVAGLVLVVLGASALYAIRAYARSKGRASESWAIPFAVPLLTLGVVLAPLTVLLVRARSVESPWVAPAVAACFVVASAYFVLGLCALGAAMGTVWFVRGLYRWSAVTSERAWLAIVVLAVVSSPVLLLSAPSPVAASPQPLAPPAPRTLREVLLSFQALPSASVPPAAHSASTSPPSVDLPSATLPSTAPAAAPLAAPESGYEDKWQECAQVFGAQEQQIRASIQVRFRLSADDAHDVARDALLSVCASYAAGTPYASLGAVFQTAAENRAKTDYRRGRYLRCAVEPGDELRCDRAQPDLVVLVEQRRAIVEKLLCDEPKSTQAVFYLRIVKGRDFRTIGQDLGLSEATARDTFSNLTKKLRKRLWERCGS